MATSLISRLWRHLSWQRKFHVICLIVLMVAASLAELVSIGMVVPFLSVLVDPSVLFENKILHPLLTELRITSEAQLYFPITAAFCGVTLLAGLIRVSLLIAQTKVGYLTGAELGVEIFRKTLHQPYERHLLRNTSDIIAGIAHKTTALVQQGIIALLTIVSYSLLLVAIVSVLVFINAKIAITALLIFGGIYSAMVILTKPILERQGRQVAMMQVEVVRTIQEGLGAIRDILIDGNQPVHTALFKESELKLRRAQISHIVLSTSPKFIIESLGIVLIATLAYSLLEGPETAADIFPVMGALALGAQRLLPILQQLYASWSAFRAGQAAFSDALELLDQSIEPAAEKVEPIAFSVSVRFSSLSFRYQGSDDAVLDNLDFEVPKGGRIGIIGSTGSGKSTILDIMMGLLKPSSGELLVDGVVIDETNARKWQANISHVPQTIFLTDATIAENIAFGVAKDNIDHQRLKTVIEQAQLSQTISNLRNGYETVVGERGVRLSGGQRQRLGIARALYKGSDFIVFDEATSALDSSTENAVMSAIDALPKEITMVIVAHRTSTLATCDRIYRLTDSRLVQTEIDSD